MPKPFRRSLPLVLTAALMSAAVSAQKGPAAPDVLRAAGDYLVQYSQKLAAVAADEAYLQYDTSSGQMSTPRRLSADVVFVGNGAGGAATFRDVYAIDNAPVRPHEDRLTPLFKSPSDAAVQQASALSEESVGRYLNPNLHALDQPTSALEFLRKDNQERSTFKVESVKSMDGAQVAILRFTERNMPRIFPMPENPAATGRFWVDVSSGAVRQTEIGLTSKTVSIRSTVKYALDRTLDLWLPAEMMQQVEVSGPGSTSSNSMGSGGGYNAHQGLEGHATYSKYRAVK